MSASASCPLGPCPFSVEDRVAIRRRSRHPRPARGARNPATAGPIPSGPGRTDASGRPEARIWAAGRAIARRRALPPSLRLRDRAHLLAAVELSPGEASLGRGPPRDLVALGRTPALADRAAAIPMAV